MPLGVTNISSSTNSDAAARVNAGLNEAAAQLGKLEKTTRSKGRPTGASPPSPEEQALIAELANAESITDAMGLERTDESALDLITLITLLRNKMDENQLGMSAENVKRIQERQAKAAEERMAKAREARIEAEKAKNAGMWGKVFGWIAAGAMILGGAALLVAGGSGAALLAGGIAMMAVMVLQETGAAGPMMNGIASAFEAMGASSEVAHGMATAVVAAVICIAGAAGIAAAGPMGGIAVFASLSSLLISPENLESMGMSKNDATWTSLGLTIGLMAASIGAGIAGVKGVGAAASQAAQTAESQVAGKAVEAAKAAQRAAQSLCDRIAAAVAQGIPPSIQSAFAYAGMIGSCVQLAAAGGGVAVSFRGAYANRDAAMAQADVADFEAVAQLLEDKFKEEADRIKEVVESITERVDALMDILDQAYASQRRTLAV